MLTQHEVRKQLDTIADEVAQPAGLYYELFSRLYSQRVRRWIRSVPHPEAVLIERMVENDPDYLAGKQLAGSELIDSEPTDNELPTGNEFIELAAKAPPPSRQSMLFNPAWDMDY